MTAQRFLAPWSALLMVLTAVGTAAILGGFFAVTVDGNPAIGFGLGAIWVVCLCGHVRGYAIDGSTLRIERLAYGQSVDLTALKSVESCPGLIRRSMRVGNGGLFSYSGWFWNRTQGWLRVVATDAGDRCVLLTLDDQKWVVSPDDPRGFVEAARRAAGLDG